MNKADNESGTKAVDSLINYETVKVLDFFIVRQSTPRKTRDI